MNAFDRVEEFTAYFVRWMTRGKLTRYALFQRVPLGGYTWALVHATDGVLCESAGAYYDSMGKKVPGPGEWHPRAEVCAAQGARKHASFVRSVRRGR